MIDIKTYNQILADIETWIIGNQSTVTSFREGNVLTSMLEAFSRELAALYVKTSAGYDLALKQIPGYAFNMQKLPGAYATGDVTFECVAPAGSDIHIPIGTLVATGDGLTFETQVEAIIALGNTTSGVTGVQAVELGESYNVPSLEIVSIVTPVEGVDSVSNANAMTGGRLEESDANYLTRFALFISGLGKSNKNGLIAGALTVSGVKSASVYEHFPPVSDFNATLYIDDGTSTGPSAALIAAVQDLVDGDGTSNNPGLRAAGVNIRVLAPTVVPITIAVEVTDSGRVDRAFIQYSIEQAATTYVNNLAISQDCIKNELIQLIMEVQGVTDIDLTSPAANTSIGSDQVARIDTITVTWAV
jgi:uncharacterized phage protein gp47/JayE